MKLFKTLAIAATISFAGCTAAPAFANSKHALLDYCETLGDIAAVYVENIKYNNAEMSWAVDHLKNKTQAHPKTQIQVMNALKMWTKDTSRGVVTYRRDVVDACLKSNPLM